MAFFTRILNIKRALLIRLRDERQQSRHRVGADFPLLASLKLTEGDGSAPEATAGRVGEWSGRVSEVSAYGLSLRLPPEATATRNEVSTVRFDLEGRRLDMPCSVAHFRVYPAYALCGLRLEFGDFAQQRAWHQIVEAVGLGASFTPVEGRRAPRPALGLVRRQWSSLRHSRLTEWRETGTRKLDRFEFLLEDFRIESRMADPDLTIRSEGNHGRRPSPTVDVEVRQLLLWIVANMPASVPADLKKFMCLAANAPDYPPKR